MKPTPEAYAAALKRLNIRQQERNIYTNITRDMVLREIRRKSRPWGPAKAAK